MYADPLQQDLELMIHFVFGAGLLAVIVSLITLVKQFGNQGRKERREAFRLLLQPFLYPLALAMYADLQYPDADPAGIDKAVLQTLAKALKGILPGVSGMINELAAMDGQDGETRAKMTKLRERIDCAVIESFLAGEERG